MSNSDVRNQARYAELLERAAFELKMAIDLAVALKLPYKRTARLQRARREIGDEQREAQEQTPEKLLQG